MKKEQSSFPPFDQGVFLMHLNKGKQHLKQNEIEQAKIELEIALKYRPEEEELLNILGMVYFKLKRYSDAEVLYKKLVKLNPDVFILRSNLGVVLFKQGKTEEAMAHFQRAVDLKPNYLKAHLYLGLIYKKLGKLEQALEHFKFAQAEAQVKELEEILKDKKKEVSKEESPEITKTFKVQPIDEGRPLKTITDVFQRDTSEILEKIEVSKAETAKEMEKKFYLHHNGFLEIHSDGKVYVRRSSLRSYVGNFAFEQIQDLKTTTAQEIVLAKGKGKLFVFEKGNQTYLFELNQEFVYVEGSHILALEENLLFRSEPIHDYKNNKTLQTFKIYGKGALALTTHMEPLTLRVTPEYPLTILSSSIVAWTGNLYPIVGQKPLEREGENSFLIRFEGEGLIIADEEI